MQPGEALRILHNLAESMQLNGKDRDVARQATQVLQERLEETNRPKNDNKK